MAGSGTVHFQNDEAMSDLCSDRCDALMTTGSGRDKHSLRYVTAEDLRQRCLV